MKVTENKETKEKSEIKLFCQYCVMIVFRFVFYFLQDQQTVQVGCPNVVEKRSLLMYKSSGT